MVKENQIIFTFENMKKCPHDLLGKQKLSMCVRQIKFRKGPHSVPEPLKSTFRCTRLKPGKVWYRFRKQL